MVKKIIMCLFIILIVCLLIITNNLNYVKTDSKNYILQENLEKFINKMDKTYFASQCFNKEKIIFENEEMIDYAIEYIILNYEKYSSKVLNLEKEFIYEENDSTYSSIGYVDKSVVQEVILEFFGVEDIDFTTHKFYDIKSDFLALVPMINDNVIKFKSKSIEDFSITSKNEITVNVKYIVTENENDSFCYQYKIFLDNNNMYLHEISLL